MDRVNEAPALDTAVLTKRKAVSDPAEEVEESGDEIEESGDEIVESGGENEESGDENEESGDDYVDSDEEYMKSLWTVPEWDVDSFDGLEYDSAEEEEENFFCDEEDNQKWRRFKRQLIENKGFDVEPELRPMYRYSRYRSVRDLDLSAGFGQTCRELFSEMACLCLQKYNQEKGLDVEFVEVVRVNHTTGSRWKSYITFMAKEKPEGPLVEYQAKAWSTLVKGEQRHPILCRPAPTAKLSNQN